MKTIYKITCSSLLAVLLLVPSAFAISTNGNSRKTASSNTCSRIAKLSASSTKTIDAHITTMQANFAARLAKIKSDEASTEQQVIAKRTEAKIEFEEKVQLMEDGSEIDNAQKQIIETFRTNMEQAKDDRDAAVDNARQSYKLELSQLIATYQSNLLEAADNYKSSVASAFDVASTNCDTANKAMSGLRSGVKTARQSFESERKADKITEQIKQLKTARNEAIRTANKTFATKAAEYASSLATALKTDISSETE